MLKRMITAAVAVPLIVLLVQFSNMFVFFMAILAVTVLALREIYEMMIAEEPAIGKWLAIGMGCLVPLSVFTGMRGGADFFSSGPYAVMVFCLLVFFIYHIVLPGKYENAFPVVSAKFFGVVYVPVLLSFLLLVKNFPQGGNLMLFLLFVTWAGDSGAYFVGTWIGQTPLAPKISPNKTVEGAVGSVVSSVLTAVLCQVLFLGAMTLWTGVILGIGINIMNQFGDLAESKIKRACRVKDSGTLIPGHGGVLDRIDSLLFAGPFLYYYVTVVSQR